MRPGVWRGAGGVYDARTRRIPDRRERGNQRGVDPQGRIAGRPRRASSARARQLTSQAREEVERSISWRCAVANPAGSDEPPSIKPLSPTGPGLPPPAAGGPVAGSASGSKRPIRSGRHGLPEPSGRGLWLMSLLALGVVYGDIGTSPLYAINECFFGEHAVPAAQA